MTVVQSAHCLKPVLYTWYILNKPQCRDLWSINYLSLRAQPEGEGCLTLKLVLCPLSTALSLAVENLRGVSITPETSQAFITNLGFSTEEFHTIPTNLLSICKLWMDKRSTCYMEELVEALVHTQGLGRYTTRLCNHRKCSD